MKAILVRRHHEAANIFTFWFKPEKPPNYIAGQYIEMHLAHEKADDRGIKRWFTLSSSPHEAPLISITTRHALKSSTFKNALFSLKYGSSVDISEPMGDFILPQDVSRPLVFTAGGIGITPFHSIISWLIDIKQQRDITFIYGVRDEEEIIFQELFKRYGMKRHIVVTSPRASWSGMVGQLSGKRILELCEITPESLFYISGPETMVEKLTGDLERLNVPKNQLVGDYFPGYSGI